MSALRGIELCEVIIHNHHEAFTSKIFLINLEVRGVPTFSSHKAFVASFTLKGWLLRQNSALFVSFSLVDIATIAQQKG